MHLRCPCDSSLTLALLLRIFTAEEYSMTLYDFNVSAANGAEIALSAYTGKLVLVVNTASKCGFTNQYAGLEKLYADYKDRGLVVLGFPCNQFAGQEPGSDAEIASFCSLNFGVTFPLFRKLDVKGDDAHPLFVFLTTVLPGFPGRGVKWNFTKFLVDRAGKPVKRFPPATEPEKLRAAIEKYL